MVLKASGSAILIIGISIAAPQRQLLIDIGDGTDCKSNPHELALFERSEFASECAELLIEYHNLCTAARRSRGTGGNSPCFAFLLQAFSFSNKKKMPKR